MNSESETVVKAAECEGSCFWWREAGDPWVDFQNNCNIDGGGDCTCLLPDDDPIFRSQAVEVTEISITLCGARLSSLVAQPARKKGKLVSLSKRPKNKNWVACVRNSGNEWTIFPETARNVSLSTLLNLLPSNLDDVVVFNLKDGKANQIIALGQLSDAPPVASERP